MRVVAALGGNALLRRGEAGTPAVERANLALAARALAPLAQDHDLVVTHGNGPQVGLLALQAEALPADRRPPLDVLGAESEAAIGYQLERELMGLIDRPVATLLTQVVVDPADPAFGRPSKPIGPLYAEREARRLARARGWTIAPDGRGFRRVVPSPEPIRVVEEGAIRLLLEAGVVVICAGGGGIPIAVDPRGRAFGVEAVIDKDLASALLAGALGADALLLLTDVAGVYAAWPAPPDAPPIAEATVAALRAMPFAAGSMAPKVEAACRFVEREGRLAVIGALEAAPRLLAGEAGTRVIAGPAGGGR